VPVIPGDAAVAGISASPFELSAPTKQTAPEPGRFAFGPSTATAAVEVNAEALETSLEPSASNPEWANLRPLGQIQESFIVAASPDGLWIIDQHVAHERVLFEQVLQRRAENQQLEGQQLLMPYILRLTPAQQAAFEEIRAELEASGFAIEPFGHSTVAIKAAPAGVPAGEIEKILAELLEQREDAPATGLDEQRRRVAASVACHAAIKVNMALDQRKMEWLLDALARTESPMTCPHGRPVVLKYSMREILKAFHRI
jgi:DNA mismatch repair protein MutL